MIGHDPEQLKSYIVRIERLLVEKAAISEDVADIIKEAKGVGFDAKAMRQVIRRRAMSEADRESFDGLIETYETALGMRGVAARMLSDGAGVRETARATGLSVASVSNLRGVQKTSEIEHPMTPTAAGDDSSVAAAGPAGASHSPAPAGDLDDLPQFLRRRPAEASA